MPGIFLWQRADVVVMIQTVGIRPVAVESRQGSSKAVTKSGVGAGRIDITENQVCFFGTGIVQYSNNFGNMDLPGGTGEHSEASGFSFKDIQAFFPVCFNKQSCAVSQIEPPALMNATTGLCCVGPDRALEFLLNEVIERLIPNGHDGF